MDSNTIYDELYRFKSVDDSYRQLSLIAMELVLFKPYDGTVISGKLKYDDAYVDDIFVTRQTTFSQSDINNYRKEYDRYFGRISGSTGKKIRALAGGTVVTVGLGATALFSAPAIAVALMGSSFAGLHGAALTSACLTALGGGSLAVGGFGMAGGTALVTGGGALIGLATSGAATLLVGQTSSEQMIDNCAKIATFSKTTLVKSVEGRKTISVMSYKLKELSYRMQQRLEQIKAEKNPHDKELISNMTKNISILERTSKELSEIRW